MHFPQHIGIIPDGNRTRAQEKGYEPIQGHMEGVTTSKRLIKYIFTSTDVKVLTIRGLSTENTTRRSHEEFSYLMNIFFNNTLDEETNIFLHDNRINYKWIGSPIGISEELVQSLSDKMSEHYYPDSDRTMCVAINYGGRNEIIRAIHQYSTQGHSIDDLSEEKLEHYLDTHDLPAPDLIIRTKSHRAQRLSGFMSWQAAYAELYFTKTLFPDFDESELQKALNRFDDIAAHRNFGQ